MPDVDAIAVAGEGAQVGDAMRRQHVGAASLRRREVGAVDGSFGADVAPGEAASAGGTGVEVDALWGGPVAGQHAQRPGGLPEPTVLRPDRRVRLSTEQRGGSAPLDGQPHGERHHQGQGDQRKAQKLAGQHPRKVFWADSRSRPELFRGVIVKPNQEEAEITIKGALTRIAQLNADQPFSYSREEMVAMLEEALAAQ